MSAEACFLPVSTLNITLGVVLGQCKIVLRYLVCMGSRLDGLNTAHDSAS